MSFITRTRQYLRAKFETGDRPTQTDFADLFESFWHKNEDRIPAESISGLQALVEQLAPAGVTEAEFDALAGMVAANTGNINSHGTTLQTYSGLIASNSDRLQVVESRSTQNAARLNSHDTEIATLKTYLDGADAALDQISEIGVYLQSNRDAISTHETRIQEIETALAEGVGAIQTVNGVGPDENGNVAVSVVSGFQDIKFGDIRVLSGAVIPDIDFNIHTTKAVSTVGTNAVFGSGVVALKNAKRGFSIRFVIDSKNAGDTLAGFLAAAGSVSVTFDGGASTAVFVDQVGFSFAGGMRNDIEVLMIDTNRFEIFINPKF